MIKAISDELLSLSENFTDEVSENELLREAATSSKARVLNFEMDMCKLNEKMKNEEKHPGKRKEKIKHVERQTWDFL